MTKKIQKTLQNTIFKNSVVLPVAAKPGGIEVSTVIMPVIMIDFIILYCYHTVLL